MIIAHYLYDVFPTLEEAYKIVKWLERRVK